jgi:UDP-glucose 4-epimerase
MNCLVTGHKGFIGQNLVETLKKQRHLVYGMDLKQDGRDINDIEYYMQADSIDIVYHLAATSDIRESFHNPDKMFHNNVLGTIALLKWMHKREIPYIVFASSSSVYGKAHTMPTPETAPTFPISHYAASKITGEAFIRSYCHLYGIKGRIFRFANVAGKYLAGGAIYDLTHKLEATPNDIEILGDGQQRKSYMAVEDCIHAMTMIPFNDTNKEVEVYNLSGPDNISVDELYDAICTKLKKRPYCTAYTGGEGGWPGDVPITFMDITKAKAAGWEPNYSSLEVINLALKQRKTWASTKA